MGSCSTDTVEFLSFLGPCSLEYAEWHCLKLMLDKTRRGINFSPKRSPYLFNVPFQAHLEFLSALKTTKFLDLNCLRNTLKYSFIKLR